MVAEVERTLSGYLEAPPYQVRIWDAKVIENLVKQPRVFAAFKAGDETVKWEIYIAMRTSGIH